MIYIEFRPIEFKKLLVPLKVKCLQIFLLFFSLFRIRRGKREEGNAGLLLKLEFKSETWHDVPRKPNDASLLENIYLSITLLEERGHTELT